MYVDERTIKHFKIKNQRDPSVYNKFSFVNKKKLFRFSVWDGSKNFTQLKWAFLEILRWIPEVSFH